MNSGPPTCYSRLARECSSMVEPLPSKQITRVRFPSLAPTHERPAPQRKVAAGLSSFRGTKGPGVHIRVHISRRKLTPIPHRYHAAHSRRSTEGSLTWSTEYHTSTMTLLIYERHRGPPGSRRQGPAARNPTLPASLRGVRLHSL